VVPGDGGWVVEDLEIRNGTHVNGQREFRRRLEGGDRIEIGQFVVVISDVGDAPGLAWARPAPENDDDDEVRPSCGEATKLASPKELARIRTQARLKLAPHLVVGAGAHETVHPLRTPETLVGASASCHVRLPVVKRKIAACLVAGEDGWRLEK
jgi:pSer/pThr/pTyr-binding forkhead associated (FHA) protein